jgi:proton-dependent oligopeptide transporter, POT family
MAAKPYLSAPVATSELPKGIPYIIGNEAAERFSFYGMKGILTIFMTKYLFLLQDVPGEPIARTEAVARYHDFNAWVYMTPLAGAFLADTLLGKYRTILSLSIVYCLGHLALALMGTPGMSAENWMMTGLYLIALGSGGIKPCVSAHVGDQFGRANSHWLTKVFGWFYISINVGAALSTLATPLLLEWYGPHWAFGVPGVLMAIATFLFWMGRKVFIHIPPRGRAFFRDTFSLNGLVTIAKLFVIFAFVAVFWALFDQTGSSWVLQAEDLDRKWLGIQWLPSQIQAINPAMIVTLVPVFGYFVYPLIDKIFPLTALRKISIGLFVMVPGFAIVAMLQSWIDAGNTPSIGWQLFAYAILTASEVMVSITCLEFAYTQAPTSMKSVVMALFLFSVSLGNFFTAGVNKFILVEKGDPETVTEIAESHFDEARAKVLDYFYQNKEKLPRSDVGGPMAATISDEWASPLGYRMVNKNTYKLVSLGPDMEAMTTDDIVQTVSVSRPRSGDETQKNVPLSWRESRLIEILGEEGRRQVERERGGVESIEFNEKISVGGQVKLEGADYFWFWTWTMLGTAVSFVFVAMYYQPKTYMQKEAPPDSIQTV